MLSIVPNIVFAPNICRTQNTDTGRKTQTQLVTSLYEPPNICTKEENE